MAMFLGKKILKRHLLDSPALSLGLWVAKFRQKRKRKTTIQHQPHGPRGKTSDGTRDPIFFYLM
jgi:hypothetical protein